MLTIRSVLCPVDFSEQSREALAWAVAISERRSAELTVLSVVDPSLSQAAHARAGLDLARSDAEPALRDFVDTTLSVHAQRQAKIHIDVQVGEASTAILQAAQRGESDLIVMGTHGLGGFRKLVLGSTTERVLRGTQTALLAVPKGLGPGPDQSQAPAVQLRRILMATDFREGSSAAVQWAIELARDLVVPIVMVHVVQPVVVPARWRQFVCDFDEENVARAERALQRFSADVKDLSTTRVVSLGQPADMIASLVSEHDAGLIVMGLTNEVDSKVGPGSIAYRVLQTTHVPVLVVPPLRRKLRDESVHADSRVGDLTTPERRQP